jgi:hypothetical protein
MDSRDAACFETSGILTSFKLFPSWYPSGRRKTVDNLLARSVTDL